MLPNRPPRQLPSWLDSLLAFALTNLLGASWVTHILYCVTHGLWGRLVLGLLIVPLAILNGLAVLVRSWV